MSKLITANVGENPTIIDQFKKGLLEVALQPLGTLVERVRSGGFGIPAFYSPSGVGTFHEEGGIPSKYGKDGKTIVAVNLAKEKRQFHGREYLLERTLTGDFALIKAWKADSKGNCVLKLANRNLNPDMATAGRMCIVEADEIVEKGQIDGDDIHISGIFVHRVVKSTLNEEIKHGEHACSIGTGNNGKMHEMMIKRAAKEVKNGNYVVLGCGLPKTLAKFVPSDLDVHYVSLETGVFGAIHKRGGPVSDLADGCLNPIELRKNAAITKVSDAFAGLRGEHFNVLFSEAYQVSENGDIANIEKGDKILPSPGVKMDLASAATPLVVLMEMTTNGKPNLVKDCVYKVSGKKCVSKLVTDMGVFEFRADGLTLIENAPKVTVDDIKAKTPVHFKVASNLKSMC